MQAVFLVTSGFKLVLFIAWGIAISSVIISIVVRVHLKHWWQQPYVIGPVLATIVFLAYGLATGAAGARPTDFYETIRATSPIVILILSFAYLAISLDHSGFFQYCAFTIVKWCRGDGEKLYIYLFALVSVLTIFTSNDIVILTMTPIVIYIGRQAGIRNMVPYLLSQFFAANILSMALYIGSPTNIVIGDSLDWTFLTYAKWMVLPAITSGIAAMGLTYFVFRRISKHRITRRYKSIDDRDLVFTRDMRVKVILFSLLLLVLSLTSFDNLHLEIWIVCFVFAAAALLIDFFILRSSAERFSSYIARNVGNRMPWNIVPFVFSFFFLTSGLSQAEIPRELGENILGWIRCLGDGNILKETFWGTLIWGYISGILVNIMNDIPATVFLSEVIIQLRELVDTPELMNAIITGTLVGVNPGCNMTLAGALAGLMWTSILRSHKKEDELFPLISDMSRYGIPIMFFVITVGSITAWLLINFLY